MAVACKKCYWCAKHVGVINLWANMGLLVVKLLGGIFGRSQALIADAVHSLSDVIVSVLLIVSLKVSAAPPDEDHHWGHGNIEFIVSVIFGVLLISAAVTITVVSFTSILEGVTHEPGILAVWAAAISVVANEIMFRHSICAGQQMDSPAMIANAWENRGDVYSSLAALVGVFGARMGLTFLDPVAAIAVGFMLARSGIGVVNLGLKGITDQSIDDGVMLTKVKKLVLEENNITDISRLRARKVGQKSWVDIEAVFDPDIKVSEVKKTIKRVKKNVTGQFDKIGDVVVVSRVSEPELKDV